MAIYRDPLAPMAGPRALVRRPEAPGLLRWVPRVFIVPHFLAGVGLLAGSLTILATSLVGTPATGRVIAERVTIGSKKGGNAYVVDYVYPTPDGEALGSRGTSLGAATAPASGVRKAVGESIAVRHLGVGKVRHSLPAGASVGDGAAMLGFGLLWNGLMAVFLWALWVRPLRQRWLYRHGVAVPGTITFKQIKPAYRLPQRSQRRFVMVDAGGPVETQRAALRAVADHAA
ncbi:MAG: hypothetical protein EOO75_03880, partial [Myxococcales bacterium]